MEPEGPPGSELFEGNAVLLVRPPEIVELMNRPWLRPGAALPRAELKFLTPDWLASKGQTHAAIVAPPPRVGGSIRTMEFHVFVSERARQRALDLAEDADLRIRAPESFF